MSPTDAVHADMYALRALAKAGNGKILRWGWWSRGLVSKAMLESFGFDMESEAESVKGLLKDFLNLETIPD
eukprot:12414510-Karenia_brevis.AAC.1